MTDALNVIGPNLISDSDVTMIRCPHCLEFHYDTHLCSCMEPKPDPEEDCFSEEII